MGNLTDRAAYMRGLAEGMGLDKEKKEHKLILEMLGLMDEMAQKISDLDADVGELEEYVEDLDSDLSDMEEALFGDEDDECDCDDEDGCSCCDDQEELSFDCPHCGKTNSDGAKFCRHCGNKLTVTCPACGAEVSAGDFCENCGAKLK